MNPTDTWKPELTVTDEDRFHIWADGGSNVFLTGPGGVGKSYQTRRLISNRLQKGLPIAVTASTGVAAILVGGSTVHSWAGIELGPLPAEDFPQAAERLLSRKAAFARRAENRVRSARTLLVDEVSMLPGRVLSFLDFWFRLLRDDKRPFGGVQVIFVGDFLQLSPVRTDPRAPYDWAFQAPVWKEAIDKSIILETVRRQTDQEFIGALQAVRTGEARSPAIQILRDRVRENPPRDLPRLLTHNASVDKWNALMLDDLAGSPITFEAITRGSPDSVASLAKNILAPERLELKPGALVMHLINKRYGDGEHYVVNGALGHVEEIDEDAETILVRLVDGDVGIEVERHSYSWGHLPPDRGGPEYKQYPLRLAYAATIHKSQGMTIDRAHIDVRAAREPGQTYVAFSRVRTLEGLSLKAWPRGFFISPQAIGFYNGLKPCSGYQVEPCQQAVRMVARAPQKAGTVSGDPPAPPASPAAVQAPKQADLLPTENRFIYA
jgi:hypothetical protein